MTPTQILKSTPWILKYWSIISYAIMILVLGVVFYVKTEAVASDVKVLKEDQNYHVRKAELNLRFRIVENQIKNIEDNYDSSEKQTHEQFRKVDKKLDQIIQFMLDQKKTNNNSTSGG